MNDTNGDPFGANAAETARLVREVQDLGFDAARTIVDRFAALFSQFAAGTGGTWMTPPGWGGAGRTPPGGGGTATTPPGQGGAGTTPPSGGEWAPWSSFGLWGSDQSRQTLQAELQRAADSYMAFMGQMNEAGLRFLDAARWCQEAPATEQRDLRLPDVAPGGRVSTHLWLHNSTDSAATGLRPWCPGLTSHRGVALPSSVVTCAPDRIERLDPGGSADLLVTAAVGEDVPAGTFHGLLLVDGLPDVVFPLRLRVLPTTNAS